MGRAVDSWVGCGAGVWAGEGRQAAASQVLSLQRPARGTPHGRKLLPGQHGVPVPDGESPWPTLCTCYMVSLPGQHCVPVPDGESRVVEAVLAAVAPSCSLSRLPFLSRLCWPCFQAAINLPLARVLGLSLFHTVAV